MTDDFPRIPLTHLDELWFQVGGTLCNLQCRHCFISCSPHNHSFGFLDLETVHRFLTEAATLGVKEFYFTGGEPFLNRDLVPILELALPYGPATVLTNGTILKDEWLERLRHAQTVSKHRLEFRVSLDGYTAADNDAIRGAGTFPRILAGVRHLLAFGFEPIITITRTRDDQCEVALVEGFTKVLRAHGYERPRIKVLPTLRIGAEVHRQRGYRAEEHILATMLAGCEPARFLCNHARIVTDRGVYVCPILLDAADARMGDTLTATLRPYPLQHETCYTCYQHGSICANATGRVCSG